MGDDQGVQYLARRRNAAPLPLDLDHVQRRRFLDAGRTLVTGGWLVLITHTVGNGGNHTGNAEHAAIFGLALLLLGVSMIMLSPVANRFPPGAARAADAVLFYLFGPGN